jgi:hypothetical protein
MRLHSTQFSTAVLLVAGGLLCATRLGADGPKIDKNIKVSVVAILATEDNNKIDKRLTDVANEVRKVHPQLTGFRLAKMTCKSLPVGGAETFELVADQIAAITVTRTADKNNKVTLKVRPPTLGEITYTTTCGKFFPIVTRYQTAKRESLIIAVRVQPCNGGKKSK